MTSSAESIKLTWLENPSIPIRPSYPVIQETAHFSGANQVTTTTNSHNSQKYGDLFEKLVSLIKAGTRKATASIQKHLGEDEDGILITYQESKDGQTLLHKTAIEANPDILGVLLDAGVDPDKLDFRGRSPLHLIVESGCRCKICSDQRVECIKALINSGASPDPVDKHGNTPLFYCALKLYSDCAKTLLNNGASLYHGKGEKSITTMLAEYLPDVLRNELDKCIGYNPEDSSQLQIDFKVLLQIEGDLNQSNKRTSGEDEIPPRETELLQSVLKAKDGYDAILTHPVVEAFLHFKWLVVRKLFFLLRSVYFVLLLLYTILMFRIYSNTCIDDYFFGGVGDFCPITDLETIGALILFGAVGFIIISEFYKVYADFSGYFSNGSTGYLWWILCIGWAGTLIPAVGPPPLYYHYPVAAVSLIFSWLMTLSQLGRIPWFATHVGLLVKVVQDFIRLLFTFLIVLIAFTVGFCILLPDNSSFNNGSFALFKAFMMMKGDIDYEGILDKKTNNFLSFPEYSIPAHLIYTTFVIVVTMVLTGLLIGLAVKDIEEALRKAKVNHSIRLIKEIGIFESIIRSKVLTCWTSKWLCKWYSIERTKAIKAYQLTFSPIHPDDTTLPESIKTSFLPYYDNGVCQHQNHRRRLKM